MFLRCTVVVLGLFLSITYSSDVRAEVSRTDFFVTTSDHVRIFVREVKLLHSSNTHLEPLIMLRGARVPGIASFDLPVTNGSLAADLAERTGRTVYVMDVAVMENRKDQRQWMRLLSRASRFRVPMRSCATSTLLWEEAERRHHANTVALLGWATGGTWAGYYASLHPEQVRYLILLNALYGGPDRHPMIGPGSSLADPQHPDHIDPKLGGYNFNTAPSLFRAWNEAIPVANKDEWRDPTIAKAYEDGTMESDPTSLTRSPRSFRALLGAIEDSFYYTMHLPSQAAYS